MTLDRKDIIIAVLVAVLGFQFAIGLIMAGAVMELRSGVVSIGEAKAVTAISERVLAIAATCNGKRVSADQTLMRSLLPPSMLVPTEAEDGNGWNDQVRNQPGTGSGTGLRELRVATGGR